MEANSIIFNNSSYEAYGETKMEMIRRKALDVRIRRKRTEKFANKGDSISHFLMKDFIINDDGTERPIKLKDIFFGRPFQGSITARPSIYAVTSVHYVAGYKIVIKRFEDSSDDTVWYETPIDHYHCKISELEMVIHEHLLEAIQRDSTWNKVK
jgi:hypothetical protein